MIDGSIEYGVDMSKKIEEVMKHDDEVRASRQEDGSDDGS